MGIRNQYTRNCPPSFVFCDPYRRGLQLCQNWRICPWCWGREIAEGTYNCVASAFFGPDRKRRVIDGREVTYRLASHTLRDKVSMNQPVDLLVDRTMAHMDKARRELPRNALGSIIVGIEYPDVNEGFWVSEVRTLAMVPAAGSVGVAGEGWRQTPSLTKRGEIVRQIAKFATYPVEILFANPASVVEMLKRTASRASAV